MAYGNINADTLTNSNGSVGNAIGPGFKNRIINGHMMIDQRNAGASITGNTNAFPVDRWQIEASQSSKMTAQQNAGSVTPPAGFVNYLGLTSSSAYTVGGAEYFDVRHIIEGLNVADLAWGTASASAVTLSFKVYSSLTGSFGGAICNGDNTRSYPFSYTVSSANTWTSISVTVPGDTTGTWLTTNGRGIQIRFGLGAGATYTGTVNTWASAFYTQPNSTVSVVGTNGATFYITGVQLEKGSTATSFDYRPYGTELALCQRYYEKMQSVSSAYIGTGWTPSATAALGLLYFFQKRAAPIAAVSSTSDFSVTVTGGTIAISTITFTPALTYSRWDVAVATGLTAGYGTMLRCGNSTGYIQLDSEL